MKASSLSTLGSLLADDTRAELLMVLMDGRAHTGGELARHVGVSASTASEHLAKLRLAGLVAVEAQGRHRYFRLSDSRVAELVEAIGAAPVPGPRPGRAAHLAYARTCYDHLAGELAVRIYDQLLRDGHLRDGEHLELQPSGRDLLTALGADLDATATPHRPAVRRCLDWTERRHHLAGSAATAVLQALEERRWVVRGPRPRAVRLTRTGRAAVPAAFGLSGP